MRLLVYNKDSEYSLTKDFGEDVPQYAILSHTWGADTEEVTFRDLVDGTGKDKIGYSKIRFCGEQAKRDGLQYFWVDTCCIDKSNYTELSEAINSMFGWYRNAVKCYVYLSDVSRSAFHSDQSNQQPWESAFRRSRWFTRGWTLQELIAPPSVEFFSQDGETLGNKASLGPDIREITGIPLKALQGYPLSDFSVNERMSWIDQRETTRKEDKVYSLLGIFNVYMPLIYGEGRDKAFDRLREETRKASKGMSYEDFAVSFSLVNVPEINQFVSREKELAEMHKNLGSDGSRRTVILSGLGGIGKTQLSIAYAKRHRDSYSAIFWLNIKDKDSLKQSFVKIARQILREHPSANGLCTIDTKENLEEVISAVKAWLSLPNNTRWLMIYDNYDNPKVANNTDSSTIDICEFLPESYQGSVIITSRSSQVDIGYCIPIVKLQNMQDSLEILSHTSRRDDVVNDPDAARLAEELDGFPLALATAGAYLNQTALSFSDYLRLYKQSWSKLQRTSPELRSYEDRTLYSTWQVSYDHVEAQNKLSANLLRLWAYFDNQDLWFELLWQSYTQDPEWIQELIQDELSFHNAVRVLSNHGLVEVDRSSPELVESRGYSIHACVHAWTIHVLNKEWDNALAKVAIRSVVLHIPEQRGSQWWLTVRRLLQHATRCSSIILSGLLVYDDTAWACDRLGYLYAEQNKLAEAEEMCEKALQIFETALGPEDMTTLYIINNLGILYKRQGKLDKAEEMYQRALQGKEKAVGVEHNSTLETVNNLGILYLDQGKMAEAEQMYRRALKSRERVLGIEHTSTLSTVNSLGILYDSQGKLFEAKQMYQRAFQGYEKALGRDNIATYLPALRSLWGLGNVFSFQADFVNARRMYSKALAGFEKIVGIDHPESQKLQAILRDLDAEERGQDPEDAESADEQSPDRNALYTAGAEGAPRPSNA